MGRRPRVHPAAGGALGLRHEEVYVLDPSSQVRRAAVHQVGSERHRRRDQRQRRQRCGGGRQGVERPRESRALQRRVQQPMPAAHFAATDGSSAVQGLEPQ